MRKSNNQIPSLKRAHLGFSKLLLKYYDKILETQGIQFCNRLRNIEKETDLMSRDTKLEKLLF